MLYVVLELDVQCNRDAPKDHCTITKLSYQIIEESKIVLTPIDTKSIIIKESQNTLQTAIATLDHDISSCLKNSSFDEVVLCSLFSAWHIRVTLQREAYDSGLRVPSYLKYPRLFELLKEYERLTDMYPGETFLNMTNHLEEVDSELLEYLTATFPRCILTSKLSRLLSLLHDLRIEREELDTAISLSVNTLIALHMKSSSTKDASLVFKYPYDSAADMKSFIREQSKVLYINNLPPDITQGELEAWFGVLGARPVGLWTLKPLASNTEKQDDSNLVDNHLALEEESSNIFGFAVFESHQDAAQILTLNGRSMLSHSSNTKLSRVVEHVIEIQPSSMQILENSNNILIPFPQSKNSPRPGDWTCPICQFSNFQRRTECLRCQHPGPRNGNDKNRRLNFNNGNGSSNISERGTTYPGVQRNDSTNIAHKLTMFNNLQQIVHLKGGINNNNDNKKKQKIYNGSNIPFRAGDWKCVLCTYHNFAKNVMCLRCGGPKARGAPETDHKGYSS